MSELIDITVPLSENSILWPGSENLSINPKLRIDDGDSCNLSSVGMSLHSGTHVDAPWHMLNDGKTLDKVSLDAFWGRTFVVDLSANKHHINDSDLENAKIPNTKRLLIRSSNSEFWQKGIKNFQEDFIALDKSAARWIVAHKIKLVGIDYLSIEAYESSDFPVHKTLLSANTSILEGVNLSPVKQGFYDLSCLPLAFEGVDGSPVRAVLKRLY